MGKHHTTIVSDALGENFSRKLKKNITSSGSFRAGKNEAKYTAKKCCRTDAIKPRTMKQNRFSGMDARRQILRCSRYPAFIAFFMAI
ncbi:MAG: hypothetical protein LUD38_14410 [Parabacteroides sp.]|nr:hypothetical protein [Parabacteroides sp.]